MLYKHYRKSLENSKHILGEHAIIEVEGIVSKLVSKKKYLFHYNFVGKCTFGFKGDSICESSFSGLKSNRSKSFINGRAPIDSATISMIDFNKKKERKRSIEMMADIDRDVIWSRAKVNNDLTRYALGIFNANFDSRLDYEHHQVGEKEWLVVHSSFGKKGQCEVPTFDRVRKVCLDGENFMNCTCGKTGEYMIPCVHICRVIDKNEHFNPCMFHVRWLKLFNYAVARKEGHHNMQKTLPVLKDLLKDVRENHFRDDGTYKGVPMSTSSFLDDMTAYEGQTSLRQRFLNDHFIKSKEDPKLAGVYSMSEFQLGDNNDDENFTKEGFDTEDLSFSICSQTEYNVSQTVEDIQNELASFQTKPKYNESYFNMVMPAFEEALNVCKSEEDAQELSDHLHSFAYKMIARNGNHTMHDQGTSFFGENLSNRNDSFERRKFAHEKRGSKKSKRS